MLAVVGSPAAAICATQFLTLVACGPKQTDGEEDTNKSPAELLEEACASFCERALACPLGRYAEEWEFDDEQGCYNACLLFHADAISDPPEMCVLIRAELWSCAGAIETCEMFDAFEDVAYGGGSAVGEPCKSEHNQFMSKCNFF